MYERAQPIELCPTCIHADLSGFFSRCYTSFRDQGHWLWKYGNNRDTCLFCDFMLTAFTSSKQVTDISSLSLYGLRLKCIRRSNPSDVGVLYGYEESRDMTSTGVALMDLGFVDMNSTLQGERFPRWLIPPLLNTSLLNSWMHFGGEIDGAGGRTMRTGPLFEPHGFRLLDCVECCLTLQFNICQYLALSYVWGPPDAGVLKTVTENLNLLYTKDSLVRKLIAGKRVPLIIRDAMRLVVQLGFRYLWVDALCILQDSLAEQKRLIDAMDRIYESAYATIIVPGCQNSDSAIPGVSTRRAKINAEIGILTTGQYRIYCSTYLQPLEVHVRSGSWRTRGWTLQEQLLSRRCLYLTDTEAFFYGGRNWLRESMQQEPPPGATTDGPLIAYQQQNHLQGKAFSEMTYPFLVRDYTKRQLTHASDILRAFSGIYSTLCHMNNCGIPIEISNGILPNLLPKTLLWTCKASNNGIEQGGRRINTTQNANSTWAWSSRAGRVKYIDDFHSMIILTANFHFGSASPPPNHFLPANTTPAEVKLQHETLSGKQELLRYWPENQSNNYHSDVELKAGELGFWAPCIGISGDFDHFFESHVSEQFTSSRGLFGSVFSDFGLYGGIAFDDSSHERPNELVMLAGVPRPDDDDDIFDLFTDPPCESIVGLAVRTNSMVSTRLGLVELFYRLHNTDGENAMEAHKSWMELVTSDRTEFYWRFVVLK